ncbi:MAG: hypothetical protein ACI8PT_002801 [Gammaproteobacteria bacterium]|jgi:hypothetical protein
MTPGTAVLTPAVAHSQTLVRRQQIGEPLRALLPRDQQRCTRGPRHL